MSIRSCLSAVSLIGAALIGPAAAADPPTLELYGPASDEQYLDTASIVVSGRIDPPLRIDVKISLYHVVDDKSVLPEGGARIRVNGEGRFSVSLEPRAGGWTAGRLRCVVTGRMRSLRQSVEFTVIDHSSAAPVVLSKDSGITIDVGEDADPDSPYEVVAGQTFYLTGGFPWDTERVKGPLVPVRIIHFDPVRNHDITMKLHLALTYINEDGFAVFDAPIIAPPRLGNYILQLRRPVTGEDGRTSYKVIERPLVIVAPAR